ncbi:hypothetical protein BLS_006480 [Venturia inaequalis]|uniref:glycine--tRNA ligase n=1 Tax=Venturia inaequalis TaxID=5025 RepID=A0A8H3UN95_VENIN|nr:hypothetical protein EG327_009745 [Venturia inaequalis]KAE9982134.1 hypothetical protein BLS_006480 [Venturia inaequalis]
MLHPLLLRSSHFSSRSAASCRHFTTTSTLLRALPVRVKQQQKLQKSGTMAPPMTTKTGKPFDRNQFESVLKRRLFFTPAFEIYDWCSKDPKTGEIFRADHLVEAVLEDRLKGNAEARGQAITEEEVDAKKKKLRQKKNVAVKLEDAVVKEYEEILAKIDNYDGAGLGELMTKYDIRNPANNNQLEPPVAFNLMFETKIGPTSQLVGYLRPETAQGQFLNFAKLLEFNNQQMPFASASIGKSFRNEISPRAGLLRVREFLMAEIEHFVDPEGGKKHARFSEVVDVELELLNREVQLAGKTEIERMKIGDAVAKGVVDNETLGYFLARIQLFLASVGVDQSKIRFRQHMANEMAHYAADCWDAELLTSYGWIECVGCADRSAYDLSVHSKATGAQLLVREIRPEPLKIEEYVVDLNKAKFGPKFKKDGKAVQDAVEALSQDLREKLSLELESKGEIEIPVEAIAAGKATLPKELVTIEKRTRIEHTREYVPNVIEPSFGIGRILYALMEHNYWTREGDEARGVISFPGIVAPTKVLLCPLSGHESFRPITQRLSLKLRRLGISNRVDDSGASIGKRYARNDELGTALGITVDFQSVEDSTFTLRDRDTTKQVRASEDEILKAIQAYCEGNETWAEIQARLPLFEGQELEKEGEEKAAA